MSDPTPLTPVAPKVDQDVVQMLEHALELALSGEFVSIAIAAEHTGMRIATAFAGDITTYTIVGALETLKLRILAADL